MLPINETELAIIEAARKVFISKGYEGTTLKKIASEAKVNQALLHYYYRSKEKLFEIVFTEACRIIQEKLILITKSEDNIEEIIKKLIDVYVNTLIDHPYLPNFILGEISRNPDKVVKIVFQEEFSTFTVLRIIVKIKNKLLGSNIEASNPLDLILNVISLNVFPFLIRPLIMSLFKVDEKQFNNFMIERKANLSSFILK